MEGHYKLYQGYVKKTNECREILKGIDYAEAEGNQVFSQLRSVSIDYTFRPARLQGREPLLRPPRGRWRRADGPLPAQEIVESEYPGGVEMWKQAVRKAASSARGWRSWSAMT